MRSFLAAYEASPFACVVAFSMTAGCVPPRGVKPVVPISYFAPLSWTSESPRPTADEVARELVRRACATFACTPRYLRIDPPWLR